MSEARDHAGGEVDPTTTVVNVRVKHLRPEYNSLEEWLGANPKHVYIGRGMGAWVRGAEQGSPWANPFSAKKYGREECIKQYRKYILESPQLLRQLETLRGCVLGCWCKPEACHGDVLVELLEEATRAKKSEKTKKAKKVKRAKKNKKV